MHSKLIVLSVEDDEADAFLLARKMGGKQSPVVLHQVDGGDNAMAYLEGTGRFVQRSRHPLPDLLLLDINMPGMDGFDVLRFVRGHSVFKFLPAIMLTSSGNPRDRQQAMELGADGYLVKDLHFNQAYQAMDAIARAWPETEGSPVLPQALPVQKPKRSQFPAPISKQIARHEALIAASFERLARSRAVLEEKRELVARTLLSLQQSWNRLRL